jgi:hypothetical protein
MAHRKNQDGAIRFVPAVKAVLLCALLGGSCVGYVVQKNQIFSLGETKKKRERRLEELRLANKLLTDRLEAMKAPWRLEDRVKQMNLGLFPAQRAQMIWLDEPGVTAPLPAPATPLSPARPRVEVARAPGPVLTARRATQ